MPRIPLFFLVLPKGVEVISPNQANRYLITREWCGRISLLISFPQSSSVSLGRGGGSGAQEDKEVSRTRLLIRTESCFPVLSTYSTHTLFSLLLVHILLTQCKVLHIVGAQLLLHLEYSSGIYSLVKGVGGGVFIFIYSLGLSRQL